MRKASLWFGLLASTALGAAVGCTSATSGRSQDASAMGWVPGAAATRNGAVGTSSVSPDDPTSLAHKLPTPGPDLFVATAHMYEQTNEAEQAAGQYERALKADPGYLPALLCYAQLHDSREEYGAADKLYTQAAKKHPKDPSVFNDWGLSYERRGKLPEAVVAMSKAVELDSHKPLYRNNLAMFLVELNKPQDAYRQLVAVNSPAVAHYNLASLLHRKGNDALAAQHFALAASDPALPQARLWANRLAANSGTVLPPMVSASPPPAPVAQMSPQLATRASAQMEAAPPAPADGHILLASRPTVVVARVAPLPANDVADRGLQAPVSVRYPQSIAAVAQSGDVAPMPSQIRALPPVIKALPPVQ